jgi:hypothetical protein
MHLKEIELIGKFTKIVGMVYYLTYETPREGISCDCLLISCSFFVNSIALSK